MKLYCVALAGAFVFGSSGATVAAPLRIPNGQIIKACAKRTVPPVRDAMLCTQNIRVSGGAPKAGGYIFRVKTGTELPRGVFLLRNTGVVTARTEAPPLPASGRTTFDVTVSDGTRNANGRVALQMDTNASCSCPDLTAGSGDLPDAFGNQPYGVALPVTGPHPDETLRPSYNWTVTCAGLPAGICSGLPPGIVLDKTTGVLRGTPAPAAPGHDFVFKVRIKENNSDSTAVSLGPFFLPVCPGALGCD